MFNGSLNALFNSSVYAPASGLNDEKVRFTNLYRKIHANQCGADLEREKVYHAHSFILRIYLPLVQITRD
jgi:hypothetical protein